MQIKPHYREGRKKPWEARWYVDRRMRTKFFATEKERDKFIREFSKEIGKHGDEVFKFDKALMRRWQIVADILPEVDPVDMAEYWLLNHAKEDKRTFSEAMNTYLLEMEQAGRDLEYRKHTKRALGRFAAHLGDKALDHITTKEVSDFVYGLPFKSLTQRHYRNYLAAAFKSFIRHGWVEKNPVSAVPIPKVQLAEPGILTVDEMKALFRDNEKIDKCICGLLALGAFAGMRSSAISRLSWDELDFDNRAILTPAEKTKKGRRHYIEGLPDNLWEWLEQTPKKAFKMPVLEFKRRREKAFIRAGLLVPKEKAKVSKGKLVAKAPPKNCLRHSFVSYHVALHRDPGKTSLLVSHKDQKILWDHYLGVARQEDGEKFFKIVPTK